MARVSLRNVRAVTGATMARTDHHEALIRDGVVPALKAAEFQLTLLQERMANAEAWRERGLWGRLRWLVTGH